MLIGENLEGFKIKVRDRNATITTISPYAPFPSATLMISVESEELFGNEQMFNAIIPAKEYTKDELIALVTQEIEKHLKSKRRPKKEVFLREYSQLEKIAVRLSAVLGLKYDC